MVAPKGPGHKVRETYTQGKGTPDAVSYTHLDVYKRQVQANGHDRGHDDAQQKDLQPSAGGESLFNLTAGVSTRLREEDQKAELCQDLTGRERHRGHEGTNASQTSEDQADDQRSSSRTNREAVSYTHLDVYKRQVKMRNGDKFVGRVSNADDKGATVDTGAESHTIAYDEIKKARSRVDFGSWE